jgi:hypothetical protein
MSDYRTYLKAVGRKPIKGQIRTQKKAGDVELCWHPEKGYVGHVHEAEPVKPRLKLVKAA